MAKNTFKIDGGFKVLPGSWRNFAGEARTYNRAGDRNFNIEVIDISLIEDLKNAGYKIKTRILKDEDGKPRPDTDPMSYFNIKIKFNDYGPKIHLYSPENPNGVLLTEETVGQLDTAEIVDCVLSVNPYEYDSELVGKGVTAYLNEMHVKIKPNQISERFGFKSAIDISDGGLPF